MPTPDDFRALARSSPWLTSYAHFTVRRRGEETVMAWLTRPGRLRYREGNGAVRTEIHRPTTYGFVEFSDKRGGRTRSGTATSVWARDHEPVRREDGLVLELPPEYGPDGEFRVLDSDDPMVGNYEWVAMLNPYELSHDVELTDVREVLHHGRRAWAARCVPLEEYDPKCGCCPLLWSEISDREEYGDDEDLSGNVYPVAYDVVLDRATGFFVHRAPVWDGPAARTDLDLDVEVHASS